MMPSTLVSYAKTEINELIPGLQIANYCLKASNGLPTTLVIEDSYYYKPDIDGNQDRVFVPSFQIAESLVHMHITSQLLYNVEQHPAIFSVPNAIVKQTDVENLYKETVNEVLRKQRRWFVALVKLADDDWHQVRRHQMISGIQRIAAKELGLSREWLFAVEDESEGKTQDCPFCGTVLLDNNAPICPQCGKVHNPARLAQLESMLLKAEPKSR